MGKTRQLDSLFNPSSVAIIGASKRGIDELTGGGLLLKGLIKNGFKGKLYPVNPKESEVMGLKSYPTVLDIRGDIDLAVIAVPATVVPQVIADCGQKGIKFAVVHSVGFSELSGQGRELESEVVKIARRYGTRIVGPNCMGVYCPQSNFNTISPQAKLSTEVGPVALLAQSGWVSENFIESGYERGLRFSKVVSLGNQSDLTFEEFFKYLADDSQTKVVACYIEGIKGGREFLQLANQISRKKPMIVLKAGRSRLGVRTITSHTGALAGNSAVFEAALRQNGVVNAHNLDEFIDLTMGFTCPVLPSGNKLGVLVEAGGVAVASADISEALGLEMPTFSTETQEELANVLHGIVPPFSNRQNPVDIVWVPKEFSARTFLQCSRIMLKEVDSILILNYTALDEYFASELVALRDELKKPIMLIPGYVGFQRAGMSLLARKGIPTFTIPERALQTLSAMFRYSTYLRQS